ncbi:MULTISPECIES: hypothetical protein [unclassified Arthrobacter]|uniref:hypothetical protein n=1 Tax=unclassified Arthrobacter TaxID=235627 RepID=UPI00031CAA76|nr:MULTISPECIES: hypothetical protein [unclassified Arthrobacter]PVE19535.1 hypothetical protein DDA93_01880 [Arthrobacter sp. Bz4]
MSLMNRTTTTRPAAAHRAAVTPARPMPLLGGRYVTTPTSGTPAEGTYVTTRSGGTVQVRGTYVTSSNRSIQEHSEGRYTDRG